MESEGGSNVSRHIIYRRIESLGVKIRNYGIAELQATYESLWALFNRIKAVTAEERHIRPLYVWDLLDRAELLRDALSSG